MSPRLPASNTRIFRISSELPGRRERKKSTHRTIGRSSNSTSRITNLLPLLNFTRHPRAAASASFFDRPARSLVISLVSFSRIAIHWSDFSRRSRRIKRHPEHRQRPAKPRTRLASKPEQPLGANELNPSRCPRLHPRQKVHRSPQPVRAPNAKAHQSGSVFVDPELLLLRPETHANVMRPKGFNLFKDGLVPIFGKGIILQG